MFPLREALQMPEFRLVRIIAGREGLDRPIRWVHIVDIPEITPWLRGGELLLTTGYGWPREPSIERQTIRALNDLALAGILFETGKFIRRVPKVVCDEADQLGLPILVAPYEVKFIDITEAIHRAIVEKQYAHLNQLEQIHRVLTKATLEADDLQDIADVLSGLLHRSVTIENDQLQMLAHSELNETTDQARADTLKLGRTPPSIIQALERRGELRRLKEAREPIKVPPIPEIGMASRVVCPVRTAHDLLGYVWIIEGPESLGVLDIRALEQTAALVAMHMLRQQTVASVESRIRQTFVDALLRNEFGRSASLQERARLVGFNPSDDYVVGILTISPSAERGRRWAPSGQDEFDQRELYARAIRNQLDALSLPSFMTYLLNQIVFFLPASRGWSGTRATAERLWEAVGVMEPSIPLMLTFGDIHRGAGGVARSYSEARRLVELANPMTGLFLSHEHPLLELLHSIDRSALEKLQAELTAKLGGQGHDRILRRTLLTYLSAGFNIQATAKVLGVHRNTVRQRLSTIRQSPVLSIDDPKFWLELILLEEAGNYRPLDNGTSAADSDS